MESFEERDKSLSKFSQRYLDRFHELLKLNEHEKAGQMLIQFGYLTMEGKITQFI